MALIKMKKKELALTCPHIILGDKLGEGGNAQVFAAEHRTYGRVAVKFMLNDNTKRYLRFKDEVLVVTNRLKGSPWVLPILESHMPAPSAGMVPWYVMPAAEKFSDSLSSLSWRDRLPALIELAEALVEIHACSVAHRDIKPENLFRLGSTCRFGDFGLAAFPERAGVTSTDEPMGPRGYLAPEMLADHEDVDVYKADVYSLAKTVWILLTEEKYPFGGQYNSRGAERLSSRLAATDFVHEPLDSLLEQSTDSDPAARPSTEEFAARLRDVAVLQDDHDRANPLQWEAAELDALRYSGPVQVTWEGANVIATVLSMLSRKRGLNHCFFPNGGGLALTSAATCEGGAMLALGMEYSATVIVKPLRLTLERFTSRPEFSYAVLETLDAEPFGIGDRYRDDRSEHLKQLNDFDYVVDDADDDEPRNRGLGVSCERWVKGGLFVIAPTRGIYNEVDDYMGTADSIGRSALREKFQAYFDKLTAAASSSPMELTPFVQLLSHTENERQPFNLEYIDGALLQRLIEIDDVLVKARQSDRTSYLGQVDHARILEKIIAGPSSEELLAQKLLQDMTSEQQAEYLAVVNVGRNVRTPAELKADTASNLRSHHELHYLMEKMGKGFFRKALRRFGLEVLTRSALSESPPRD